MEDLMESLRNTIENSGQTRYAIGQATGVSQAQLSRFVRGMQGISIENAQTVADHLGYEIVLRPKRRTRRTK